MSSRYGYDDKDVYSRRSDYGERGSWDRPDRRDWDRDHWDRAAPRDSRRDWDDRPARGYEPPPSHSQHWDRRDIGMPERERMPSAHRDDWGRGSWGRPMPPPPADRDYLPRDRDRPIHDRNAMDWEPPAPRAPLVRKREPDIYEPPPRDFAPNPRHPPTAPPSRGGPDEADWKRRKVDLDKAS